VMGVAMITLGIFLLASGDVSVTRVDRMKITDRWSF
jgi:hypothetical protein